MAIGSPGFLCTLSKLLKNTTTVNWFYMEHNSSWVDVKMRDLVYAFIDVNGRANLVPWKSRLHHRTTSAEFSAHFTHRCIAAQICTEHYTEKTESEPAETFRNGVINSCFEWYVSKPNHSTGNKQIENKKYLEENNEIWNTCCNLTTNPSHRVKVWNMKLHWIKYKKRKY